MDNSSRLNIIRHKFLILLFLLLAGCGGSSPRLAVVEVDLSGAQVLFTVQDAEEEGIGGLRKILANGTVESAINTVDGDTRSPFLQAPNQLFTGADGKIYISTAVTLDGEECLLLRYSDIGQNLECYGAEQGLAHGLHRNYGYQSELYFDSDQNFYFISSDGTGADELDIPDTILIKKLSPNGVVTKLLEYSSNEVIFKNLIVESNGTVFLSGYFRTSQNIPSDTDIPHFLRELSPDGTVEDLTPCTEEAINPVIGEPDFDREYLCSSFILVNYYSLFPSEFNENYEVYDAVTKTNGNIVFAGQRLSDNQYLVGEFNQTTQETLVRATSNYKITHIVVLEE